MALNFLQVHLLRRNRSSSSWTASCSNILAMPSPQPLHTTVYSSQSLSLDVLHPSKEADSNPHPQPRRPSLSLDTIPTIAESPSAHSRDKGSLDAPDPSVKPSITRRSLSLSLDGRKNGDSTKSSTGSGGTPPTDRKSKLSTLSRLFRPWKWRRKKKRAN